MVPIAPLFVWRHSERIHSCFPVKVELKHSSFVLFCDILTYFAYRNHADFEPVATGLGVNCANDGCWDNVSPSHSAWNLVGTDNHPNVACYYPKEDFISCTTDYGWETCYTDILAMVCPCQPATLENACHWESPPHKPAVTTWSGTQSGTSCLDRINYWRKKACEDGWPECPPEGLPPMTECTCCHSCANAESEYDKQNGAHASFGQCGGFYSQGQGGGSSCAAVIDMFVSERAQFGGKCEGHCGPIVAPGCQTFFWGEYNGFYTLDWGDCPWEECNNYCANPSKKQCFLHSPSDVDTSGCANAKPYY